MERAYSGTVDEHLGGNSDGAVEIASSPSSASCQRRGSALDVARRQQIEQRTPQQRELLGALSQPLGGVTNLRRLRLERHRSAASVTTWSASTGREACGDRELFG